MSEWLLERTYDKSSGPLSSGQCHSGAIQATVMLVRSIGFKHVVPVVHAEGPLKSPSNLMGESQKTRVPSSGTATVSDKEGDPREENVDDLFDCVYLTAHSFAVNMFPASMTAEKE